MDMNFRAMEELLNKTQIEIKADRKKVDVKMLGSKESLLYVFTQVVRSLHEKKIFSKEDLMFAVMSATDDRLNVLAEEFAKKLAEDMLKYFEECPEEDEEDEEEPKEDHVKGTEAFIKNLMSELKKKHEEEKG